MKRTYKQLLFKQEKEIPFDKYFIKGYALETLINGNISECIEYLKGLFEYGLTGILCIHEELITIKEEYSDRYEYIKARVFTI